MAVFYSFYYERDAARVQQIVNMGVVEGQKILNAQGWESVKRQGNAAIERWIDDEMKWKTAVVVLVGAETAGRPWVQHEIRKAWNEKKPLVGIRINGLAPLTQSQDRAGADPFALIKLEGGGTIGDHVTLHTPRGTTSKEIYASIESNLTTWVSGAYKRS